jgi:hypothetical protein
LVFLSVIYLILEIKPNASICIFYSSDLVPPWAISYTMTVIQPHQL